ncbi:CgeB family protein [Methylobacterium nonmethylotrophicum]|uniref:Glycosyltransferase n=1 Tax=Methylobacterium nonmethylotrophicum TaxID=1141884 RepID=A0A4Z0NGZ9_9HYPH|nr:glycosyltransferase [Methylobacterium nonmethylotrophicum]TGD95034.1 glycosyltransferase [Methylobacterium nonmethylotrophicum]
MRLVVFGLTISSSWGNGHATLWRALSRALARRGHSVVFYERDLPFYAAHRDLTAIPNGRLVLFSDWAEIRAQAARDVAEADVAMVTSYCPDALLATDLVLSGRALKVFYDLDTPVTLDRLRRGEAVEYVGPEGFAGFDLVLSYTGGPALAALRDGLGARRAAPLYGHVDPEVHRPAAAQAHYAADLSYLGTYAADRQDKVVSCLVEPARRRPDTRFLIGGAQYPQDFPWTDNIYFVRHLGPREHPAFYASSRLTLNVTRAAMAAMGWCPSGRLFEATACGAAVLSDAFDGLDAFYRPGEEILLAETPEAVLAALDRSDAELRRIAEAGRARTLSDHTSAHRAAELEAILDSARSPVSMEA